ncbi:hypothetical protein PPEP_b0467 [Pseudoalteromonas peptidolytica F12-50-A1]|uniref:Uncharacterized protein n=1 Tax=Pseudoalteromonas peptidolytica F12-50-A1 TaxID=1315280 RepID=A0A8I0T7W8_9GAMM|nr:hypothetical protein [Pseudoalteromonas peptidolytica F12-50-A1]
MIKSAANGRTDKQFSLRLQRLSLIAGHDISVIDKAFASQMGRFS